MFATPDSDVPRFMRMLTFMPIDEIAAIEKARYTPSVAPPTSARVAKLTTARLSARACPQAMADQAQSGYVTNSAQRRLAEELTRFVHGEAGLEQAVRATEGLKPGAATTLDAAALEALAGDVPSVTLSRGEVVGALVCDVMARATRGSHALGFLLRLLFFRGASSSDRPASGFTPDGT